MSCKKDVGKAPETTSQTTPTSSPTNTNVPFVEYRDVFEGNYVGTMSVIGYTVFYPSNGPGYQLHDTVITENELTTITKSTVSNTVVLSSNPSGAFGVLQTGTYSYYEPHYLPPPSLPSTPRAYTIRFRNDSVLISTVKMFQPTYRQKDVTYYTTFNGKKQ
jgi:hypothetical protein